MTTSYTRTNKVAAEQGGTNAGAVDVRKPTARGSPEGTAGSSVRGDAHVQSGALEIGSLVLGLAEMGRAIGRAYSPLVSIATQLGDGFARARSCYERFRAALQKTAVWVTALRCTASQYLAPYEGELEAMRLPPLSLEDRIEFFMMALLATRRGTLEAGQRVPLVAVALVTNRLDIAAAAAARRLLEEGPRGGFGWATPEQWDDLKGAAFLALRESILPSIQRRLGAMPLASGRKVLAEATKDGYLVTSLCRHLRGLLAEESERAQCEVSCPEIWVSAGTVEEVDGLDSRAVDDVLGRFLGSPAATEIDRRMVAILRRRPDLSLRKIAELLDVPASTVRYRFHRMIEHLRGLLET